jgi:F-type H+-transporting ATPase subunit c
MKKLAYILPVIVVLLLISNPALAEDPTAQEVLKGEGRGFIGLGAGFAIGLAALGCGMGQGRASSAALEGIARNPQAADKIFTPMIIGLALIESLAIYGLLIAIFLNGKI